MPQESKAVETVSFRGGGRGEELHLLPRIRTYSTLLAPVPVPVQVCPLLQCIAQRRRPGRPGRRTNGRYLIVQTQVDHSRDYGEGFQPIFQQFNPGSVFRPQTYLLATTACLRKTTCRRTSTLSRHERRGRRKDEPCTGQLIDLATLSGATGLDCNWCSLKKQNDIIFCYIKKKVFSNNFLNLVTAFYVIAQLPTKEARGVCYIKLRLDLAKKFHQQVVF